MGCPYCDRLTCSCVAQRDDHLASVYFATRQEKRYGGLPFADKWEIHHAFRQHPELAMKLIRNNIRGADMLAGPKLDLSPLETELVTRYVDAHVRPVARNLWATSDRSNPSDHYWRLAKRSLMMLK